MVQSKQIEVKVLRMVWWKSIAVVCAVEAQLWDAQLVRLITGSMDAHSGAIAMLGLSLYGYICTELHE